MLRPLTPTTTRAHLKLIYLRKTIWQSTAQSNSWSAPEHVTVIDVDQQPADLVESHLHVLVRQPLAATLAEQGVTEVGHKLRSLAGAYLLVAEALKRILQRLVH